MSGAAGEETATAAPRPMPSPGPLPTSNRRGTAARSAKVAFWLVIAGLLVAFPAIFTNTTVTTIAVFSIIFMSAATAWNSFSGYSGYVSIGHAVFFGAGAYTLVLIAADNHWTGGYSVFALVPLGGVVSVAIAVPFGLVALRTRRHTFVVVTIAVFFIFQLLAFNLKFLTRGSQGVSTPTPPWFGSAYNDRFYYAALCVLAVAVLISVAVRRSRFGLQLLAIRDDEDRAAGLGVRTTRVKLVAFMLSSFPVGMAGAVWGYFLGSIHPQFAFNPLFDLSVAIMAFLGGLGTISGPLLGAALLESLQQYFAIQYSQDNLYLIAYGALFLVVIVLLPRGVIPTVVDTVRSWRDRGEGLRGRSALVGGARSAQGPAGGLTVAAPNGVRGED
ncbi:MAG TPA: branched-chain amino acid ABC transporter permease [Acidimicrobiales bacterium]|nr:branched-chain amino acid ABC transporter permease [Acidimicrobiales bacterium]